MEVLQEVYFGKESVEPILKQLTVVRDKIAMKPVTPTTNLDPEIIKLNRIVEKIFGFNSFAFYIQPDHLPNAYAIPVDTYFTDEEKMKIRASLSANSTGFRYNASTMGANISLIIAMNIGALENPIFTDGELLSAMLHEIGHGFFEAVMDAEGEYTVAKKLVISLNYALGCARLAVKNGKHVTMEKIDQELAHISKYVGTLKKSIIRVTSKAKKKAFGESMAMNMTKNRIAYTNEKFADTFAAMFGYAEECHSFDVKVMQYVYDSALGVKTYPKIAETIKMYKLYIKDLVAYAFDLQDEHPAELARIKTSIDYIKRELAKEGLDPRVKNQLIDQLNSLNRLINDYKNFPKDKDSMRILRLYNIKLYEKFGGDRREKDTDNDSMFDAIDNRYREVMNSET